MNAVLSQVTMRDHIQRNDALRRRNAEVAYDRHEKYNGDNQKTLEKLEELLRGKKEPETVQAERPKVSQLGAGQVKQIVIPTGKTLEETIHLWKDVRSEAVSGPEPTTADYQLAATATSKITRTEAQILLHNYASTVIDRASFIDEAETAKLAFMELPSKIDYEVLKMQKRFEQAISSYSYQVQMKQQGFEIAMPSFYRVA